MTPYMIHTDNLPTHAGGMTRGQFIFIRPKYKGWASFWRTIYVLPGHEHNQRLLRHERKHLEQIERDGRLLFSIKYLYWLCRYGYYMNPYEVDARAAESKTT